MVEGSARTVGVNKDFAVAGKAFREGAVSVDAVRTALDRATVYVLRSQRPGVLAVDVRDGGRWVLAFTSPGGLAEHVAGSGRTSAECLSTTGADLIEQLPTDVGLLLDPGTEHAVALPPIWLAAPGGAAASAARGVSGPTDAPCS